MENDLFKTQYKEHELALLTPSPIILKIDYDFNLVDRSNLFNLQEILIIFEELPEMADTQKMSLVINYFRTWSKQRNFAGN